MGPPPEHIILLTPGQGQPSQPDLAQASLGPRERVQMFDVPSLGLQASASEVEGKACPCSQRETRAHLPEGLPLAWAQEGPHVKTLAGYLAWVHRLPLARVCQIWAERLGTTFSQASGLAACQQSARALPLVLERIQTAVPTSGVIHNDESGLRVNNKRWGWHVAASCWLTLSLAPPKRAKEASEAMGI
jgi:hypothetical protein